MNREDTKKAIEVMQAYVDGAEIAVRYFGFCNDAPDAEPLFNWDAAEYRIKPKPREFWINLYRNDGHSFMVHTSEEEAKRRADTDLKKTIKVREVIE